MIKRGPLEVKMDILLDILDNEPRKPTQIQRFVNMSWNQFKKYRDELLKSGYIAEKREGGFKTYCLTEKGYLVIDSWLEFCKLLARVS